MSIEAYEYLGMMCVGVFATLIGTGRLSLGGDHHRVQQGKKTMRWAGPLLVVCGGLLFLSTLLRAP